MFPTYVFYSLPIVFLHFPTWQCVKTLYPCSSHQNSWDLWMFIPLKMVLILGGSSHLVRGGVTPVINGISRVNPLITGVITHLLSGMSHQAGVDPSPHVFHIFPSFFHLFPCHLGHLSFPTGSASSAKAVDRAADLTAAGVSLGRCWSWAGSQQQCLLSYSSFLCSCR